MHLLYRRDEGTVHFSTSHGSYLLLSLNNNVNIHFNFQRPHDDH